MLSLAATRPIVLDATLRDGGYLNDWNFSSEQIDFAVSVGARAGADIIEVGYVDDAPDLPDALACRPNMLKRVRPLAGKALLAAMVRPSLLNQKAVLARRVALVDLIRIPVDVRRTAPAMALAQICCGYGFPVTFNLTSASCFDPDQIAAASADAAHLVVAIYLADSRGALLPDQVPQLVEAVRTEWKGPIGYHAHDNLGLAVDTTERALEAGCELIDGSIAGAGIGGRNLRLDEAIRIAGRHRVDLNPDPDALATDEHQIGVPAPGDEMQLYRLAGERNIRQEWVGILVNRLGFERAHRLIKGLPVRRWFEEDELEPYLAAEMAEHAS